MKNRIILALVVLGAPTLAMASETRLFDPVDPSLVNKEAEKKLVEMVGICSRNDMSRLGPSPAQYKRCDDAVEKVSALGRAAGYAAMAHIEDRDMLFGYRVYDVIGRSGALELVEPLVRALERESKLGIDNDRHYEVSGIVHALTALTYAEPKGTPAIQWREWANAHRGMDRAALLREHQAEAGAHAPVQPTAAPAKGEKSKLVAAEPTS